MDCPRAVERLLRAGVPATTLHNTADTNNKQDATAVIFETTTNIITAQNVLEMHLNDMTVDVDEIQPYLTDVMDTLTRVPNLPANFEPVEKLRKWLSDLHQMRASEELSGELFRQLKHDLETINGSFYRFLNE